MVRVGVVGGGPGVHDPLPHQSSVPSYSTTASGNLVILEVS